MKKLLMLAVFALASLGVAQFPATDFEVGNAYIVGEDVSYPYAMGRLNIPIGPELFGGQVFVLPEVAVFLEDTPSYWLRVQLLADFPSNTLFIDAQTSPLLGTQVRTGVRFGF
jgi:hypothetical protein